MKAKAQKEDIKVTQAALNFNKRSAIFSSPSVIATVKSVHSDRMSCDLVTIDGNKLYNVPVLTRAGLKDGKVYGDFWLPAIDDYVIVIFAGAGNGFKLILGTIVPYLSSSFTGEAVNSGNKQFTKKLLDTGTEGHEKIITKSGTTIEVESDGSTIIETPSGQYIKMDEGNGKVIINGNLEVYQ
jgi:hypothetical protein